eukprot:COSAG01_NODE_2057_length_8526_cov_21.248576_7_plen_76_part_00
MVECRPPGQGRVFARSTIGSQLCGEILPKHHHTRLVHTDRCSQLHRGASSPSELNTLKVSKGVRAILRGRVRLQQ